MDLIIFLTLLALGYFAGTVAEKRHYRSIERREKELAGLPAVTLKSVDVPPEKIRSARMVHGSAVISVDYFKRILAALRNIFGGKVKSYETLLDRARRESLLRMKESAPDASIIVNVRIETATIGRSRRGKQRISCLETVAYGTALTLEK
jgi:uncharacterized protein YbjQ (UPF0145 family)